MRVRIELEEDGHEYSIELEADRSITHTSLMNAATSALKQVVELSLDSTALREYLSNAPNSATVISPDAPQYQRRPDDDTQA